MHGRHQQQSADHPEKDHEGRLGEREETATRLGGRGGDGDIVPGGIQHLGPMMTQRP